MAIFFYILIALAGIAGILAPLLKDHEACKPDNGTSSLTPQASKPSGTSGGGNKLDLYA